MKKISKILGLALSGLVLSAGIVFATTPAQVGLHEGDLIRATGDNDIFIVNDFGYKRLFLNPAIFSMYGHLGGWSNVKTVTPAVRDAFVTSDFYRADGDTKVYKLEVTGDDTGVLRWVNMTQEQFLATANTNQIFTINGTELGWYAKGSDVTATSVQTNGLSVISTSTVSTTSIPLDAKHVELMKIQFSGTGSITGLTIKRTGLGNRNDFENIYVYENGSRLVDGRTFGSDDTIKFTGLKLTSPTTVSIVTDFNGTSGNEDSIQLTNVITDQNVTGLPVSGSTFRMTGVHVGSIAISNGGSIDDVVIGQTNAKVATFKLSNATDNEDASIKSVQMIQLGTADISNLKLVVNGVAYSGSITSDDKITFANLNLTLNDGKSMKFDVYADIDSNAKSTQTVKLDFERLNDVYTVGAVYGYGTTITSTFTATTKTLTSTGVLTSESSSTDKDKVAFYGQDINNVAKFKFTSNKSEGFYIETLSFDGSTALSNNVDKLYITYQNKSGSTIVATESVGGTGSVSFDSFADSNRPYISADNSAYINVGVKLTNNTDTVNMSNFKVSLDSIKYVGESSDKETTSTVNLSAKNGLYTYSAYPVVTRTDNFNSSLPLTDVDVLKLSVKAVGGDIKLASASAPFTFTVNSYGMPNTLAYKVLVDGVEYGNGNLASTSTTFAPLASHSGDELFIAQDSTKEITFRFNFSGADANRGFKLTLPNTSSSVKWFSENEDNVFVVNTSSVDTFGLPIDGSQLYHESN